MISLLMIVLVLLILFINVNSYNVNTIKIVSNNNLNYHQYKLISSNTKQSSSSLSAWSPGVTIKPPRKSIQWISLINYCAATSTQWALVVSFLHILQLLLLDKLSNSNIINNITNKVAFINTNTISTTIVTMFMLFMSLKSRVFSPLNNSRPKANADDPVFKNRKRPSWQPKPIFFPIIWSTIALLRTISSVLIFRETKSMLCLPIMSMMAHLCIGDTWNTINNVEKRLGTAVLGVFFVWGSVLATVYRYYQTNHLAGLILAPSAVWLTIAVALVYSIWRINFNDFNYPSLLPSPDEGPPSPWKIPVMKSFSKA